jgi:hypothetical protein
MASSTEINFFLEESTGALDEFVRKFINDTEAAPTFLRLIKEYAGNDKVGEVLNNILLKCEELLGMDSFADGFADGHRSYGSAERGTIRGRPFHCWFYNNYETIATGTILCRLATAHGAHGGVENSITVATVTLDQWSFETRRGCIIKALLLCYKNNLCRYCDELMVETCERCSLVIAAQPCELCNEDVGRMVHVKLTRGQPKVWCHQGCKRRRVA